ncbi:MAG: NAD(P)/FAD-dependent oxidoreductase [Gemmobacter sp.]
MFDFCIIGGGIAGLSAAAALSELGRVVLLEAEDAIGYHSSGRSAALYEPNYGAPPNRALAAASGDALRAAGVLSPRGLLMVATAEDMPAFEVDSPHLGMDRIGAEAARGMVPILSPDIVDAAFTATAWDIDTDRLMQAHARAIRAAGGETRTGARVTAIARTAQGWRVTARDDVEARVLVNAAGAWADGIAALSGVRPIGIVPHRRSMARIPAPGGHDVARWPMLFGPGETWYAKPDAGALIVSPAEEEATEPHDAWADDMVLAEGIARYEAHVSEPVTRLIGNWAGLRSFAPDRVLVLGRDPGDPAFLWCAGQGGYGFQTSAAAARHVADVAGGRAPAIGADVAAALDPARFR